MIVTGGLVVRVRGSTLCLRGRCWGEQARPCQTNPPHTVTPFISDIYIFGVAAPQPEQLPGAAHPGDRLPPALPIRAALQL